MFGKISEKARRQAYLSALSEDKAKTKQQKEVVSFDNQKKLASEKPQPREVFSGKEAINLANKELKVSNLYNKRAIIKNKTADMKYYSNWRDRISEISLNDDIEEKRPLKPKTVKEDGFSEFERERGIDSDNQTNAQRIYAPSKSFLDASLPADTKEENDDDFSFLDELFGNKNKISSQNTQENRVSSTNQTNRQSFVNRSATIRQDREKKTSLDEIVNEYSLEDFEDETNNLTFEDIASNASKINETEKGLVAKKPNKSATRKKKKKFDADIIGTSGFFTIR